MSRVEDLTAAAEQLATVCDIKGVETDGMHVRGRVRRAGTAVPGLLRDLDRSGIELASIEVHRPTLDDVFLTLTGRSLRDAEAANEAAAAEAGETGDDSGDQPDQVTTDVPATTGAER